MAKTTISAETTNYKGYLVRIWRNDAEAPWRASAKDTTTGEQHHFAQLENLFSFLREEINKHHKTKQ
jgi:hypothetical protein